MDNQQTKDVLGLMKIMVSSYPSQAGQDSDSMARGYLMAIEGCSFDAVNQVLRAVIAGRQEGFDNKFAPSSGKLGEWCRHADDLARRAAHIAKPPEHGITKLNFGGRDIYTADMTRAQVEELIATSGKSLDGIGHTGAQTIGSAAGSFLESVRSSRGPAKFDVGDAEGDAAA